MDGPALRTLPDPRIVARLDGLVRRTGSPRAFAAAGAALEAAVLATCGAGPLPADFIALAEGMRGALMLIQARTVAETDPEFRVDLAAAAAVLSVVLPHEQAACDGAVRGWMGLGMADPSYMSDARALGRRALLALLVDDVEQAAGAVAQLGTGSVGGALYDWVIARRQRHGAARELECWHHLWLLARDEDATRRNALVLLAALVAWDRTRAPRGRLVAWLDEILDPGAVDSGWREAL